MSGRLNKEQIIDQKGIENAFVSVANKVQPFIDKISEAAKVAIELNKALGGEATFREIVNGTKKASENTKKLNKALIQTKEALSKQRSKEYTKELNSMAQAAKKVATEEKKKNAEIKRSKTALEAKRAKAYAQELKRQERATRLLIKAKNTEAGSVQRLRAVNAIYANKMKDLNTLIPKQRAQFKRLDKSIKNNNDRISKMSKKTSRLRGTFGRMIRSIGVYAAALFGLNKLIQFFTRDLLNQVKSWSAIHFSMQTVITDQNELAATQKFLSETAINYGQDILVLTNRYIKFRAAAQQSNLTAKETMGIFDSMAKAAAVLGLKTDEVQGVFLALEQMISKGKVTTKELRRQLGERLPGAFGIMADSLGVTISELDKMLKKGEVLSNEVLPGFADAVEKAYGIESIKKIDNLIAAHGRLRTSWKQFVEEVFAENAYTRAIQNWTNMFTRLRIIGDDTFGDGIGLIDKYMLMTTQAGKSVRKFVDDLDEVEFSELDNVEKSREYINFLKQSGFTVERATKIWNEYYNARQAEANLDDDRFSFSDRFDLAALEKKLDQLKDIDSWSNLTDGKLRDAFVLDSDVLAQGFRNYRDYLESMAKAARENTEEAFVRYDKFSKNRITLAQLEEKLANASDEAEKKRLRTLYKNQNTEYNILYDNYQNRLALEIELNDRLAELNKGKGKGGKDERLKLLKSRQALELAQTKRHQARLMLEFEGAEDERLQMEYDHGREILVQKLQDLEEQREVIGAMTKKQLQDAELSEIERQNIKIESDNALLDIETEHQELMTELIENAIDYRNGKYKVSQKEREKERQDALDREIAEIYDATNKKNIAIQEQASKDLFLTNKSAKEKLKINTDATLKILENEYKAADKIQQIYEEGTEEWYKYQEQKDSIEQDFLKKSRDAVVRNEELKREEYQKIIIAASEISGRAFDIMGNIFNAQMQRVEQLHDYEIAAAGDSVEKRLMAERKYEMERANILRKQAIADKAHSAFSIIINTAEAIMATLGETGFFGTPLAAIIGSLGAAQLATVMATPIPEFAKGTKDAPETFIAGEKGQELIFKPSGEAVLTPEKSTMFSDKSFVGSTILPHDETQKWLANYAVNQSYDMIDMSQSNGYLKKLVRNSEYKEFTRNGKTFVRRGYITAEQL